jgi:hypothetical protein
MRLLRFLVPLAVAAPLYAEPSPLHEGEWEITVATEIAGMPMQIPPQTHTQCMTKADAVPNDPRNKECKTTITRRSAGTVAWKIKCSGARAAEGAGEVTYRGDSFEGHMTVKAKDPRSGQTMEMKSTMKGRRLGDCK